MSMQRLPSEICSQILQFLKKRDAYECMFICRSWHEPAIQKFYEEINLDGAKIIKVRKQLALAKEDRQQRIDHGQWVKKLMIYNDGDDDDSMASEEDDVNHETLYNKQDFLLFMSYLPNLKEIDVTNSLHFSDYLKMLRDTDSNQYLTHLEKIEPLHMDDDSELYFEANYNFRHTLTHLEVHFDHDHDDVDIPQTGYLGNLLTYLPQFTHLTHLSIEDTYDDNLTFFKILQVCPNLVSFKFNIGCSIPNELIITPPPNNQHLQELDISVPSFNAPYISYIIHYTPANLQKLYISLRGLDFYDWINNIGIESIIILAGHMSTLKSSRFYANPYQSSQRVNSQTAVSKITQFFQIMEALKGNRILNCQGDFAESSSGEIDIRVNDNNLLFQYELTAEDYGLNEELNRASRNQPYNTELSLPTTATELQMINKLKFSLIRHIAAIPYQHLQYALTNCPHLTSLEIDCMNADLKFTATGPGSSKDRPTRDNLTHVKFVGTLIREEVTDVLSTHLPNIQKLTIQDKSIYGRKEISDGEGINLNLTAFTALKKLYIGIKRKIKFGNFQTILFSFNYPDDIQYYMTKKGKNGYSLTATTLNYVESFTRRRHLRISIDCTSPIDKVVIFAATPCNPIAEFRLGVPSSSTQSSGSPSSSDFSSSGDDSSDDPFSVDSMSE